MAKKYYAVINGAEAKTKIYDTWSETERNIKHQSRVIFKSFPSVSEAQKFIDEKLGNKEIQQTENTADVRESLKSDFGSSDLVCYVDGSFDLSTKTYSYGLVVVKDDEMVREFSGKGNNPEYADMRNVAGEILGASKAVEFGIKNGFQKVHIFYDYQGIECWATGSWKRNNTLTKGYHEFMKENMKKIKVIFHKVTGHSGDRFNDMADKLARSALGKK